MTVDPVTPVSHPVSKCFKNESLLAEGVVGPRSSPIVSLVRQPRTNSPRPLNY